MIVLTQDEMRAFRAQVEDLPVTSMVFETLEACEGDLEDAAITLALHSGQEPDHSDGWLGDLAKRWRHVVCRAELREDLQTGAIAKTAQYLIEETSIPDPLAIPVTIYVLKAGVHEFCAAFEPISE